jgi:hypothetical protein
MDDECDDGLIAPLFVRKGRGSQQSNLFFRGDTDTLGVGVHSNYDVQLVTDRKRSTYHEMAAVTKVTRTLCPRPHLF